MIVIWILTIAVMVVGLIKAYVRYNFESIFQWIIKSKKVNFALFVGYTNNFSSITLILYASLLAIALFCVASLPEKTTGEINGALTPTCNITANVVLSGNPSTDKTVLLVVSSSLLGALTVLFIEQFRSVSEKGYYSLRDYVFPAINGVLCGHNPKVINEINAMPTFYRHNRSEEHIKRVLSSMNKHLARQ